jgi:hypothetical protein
MATNPYAIYVNCDGAMDYNSENSGGIGFVIRFPDSIPLDNISEKLGIYTGGDIERLEIEAIIQAMNSVMDLFETHREMLKNIGQIVFITDRIGLCDSERTNPYKIKTWRQNKIADKLAKAGKKEGFTNESLSKKGEKIGKRKYDGQ